MPGPDAPGRLQESPGKWEFRSSGHGFLIRRDPDAPGICQAAWDSPLEYTGEPFLQLEIRQDGEVHRLVLWNS